MSGHDIERIENVIDRAAKIATAIRALAGMLVAAICIVLAVAGWVWSTNEARSQDHAAIQEIVRKREAALTEWTTWRTGVDVSQARMLTILENQQRILDRLADQQQRAK